MNKIGETTWDKNKPMHSLYADQIDWNQTLMTKINQCKATLFSFRKENTERTLVVPSSFQGVFESLMSYDLTHQVYQEKYKVKFEEREDILVVEDDNYCSILLT